MFNYIISVLKKDTLAIRNKHRVIAKVQKTKTHVLPLSSLPTRRKMVLGCYAGEQKTKKNTL